MNKELVTEARKRYGLFLKLFRTEKGLTQKEVADFCEVSKQTINKVEQGKFAYSFDLVLKLSVVLGFNVMFEKKEEGNPDRFLLQKGSRENFYILTDTENKIVCIFEKKRFNETNEIKIIEDVEISASKLATIMRELGEYIQDNYPEIV